jgi:DNA-binding LacI/PurR family transcriptional regulator
VSALRKAARERSTAQAAVTIQDVAEQAGVGVGTVSRVLNGGEGVAAKTRRHVAAVIEELGYQPSPLARNLSLGRTQTLAVVVPFLAQPSVVERLRGLLQRIAPSRYELVLYDVEAPERRMDSLRRLARRGHADGGVIVSLRPGDELVEAFAAARIPVVLLDAVHPGMPYVAIDDVAGGRLATRHLLDLGHRRIAFVGDTETNPFGFTSSADRHKGYAETLAEAGVDVRREYVREGPHGRHVAHRLTNELLELPEPPTAIFAASDTQALGVLEAVTLAGLSVPGDVSVIGFDDIEVAAYVGLTTVRQPLHDSGVRAAELLLELLERPNGQPVQERLPLELVARRTTGSAP